MNPEEIQQMFMQAISNEGPNMLPDNIEGCEAL